MLMLIRTLLVGALCALTADVSLAATKKAPQATTKARSAGAERPGTTAKRGGKGLSRARRTRASVQAEAWGQLEKDVAQSMSELKGGAIAFSISSKRMPPGMTLKAMLEQETGLRKNYPTYRRVATRRMFRQLAGTDAIRAMQTRLNGLALTASSPTARPPYQPSRRSIREANLAALTRLSGSVGDVLSIAKPWKKVVYAHHNRPNNSTEMVNFSILLVQDHGGRWFSIKLSDHT
jgi:hypothetical protein